MDPMGNKTLLSWDKQLKSCFCVLRLNFSVSLKKSATKVKGAKVLKGLLKFWKVKGESPKANIHLNISLPSVGTVILHTWIFLCGNIVVKLFFKKTDQNKQSNILPDVSGR